MGSMDRSGKFPITKKKYPTLEDLKDEHRVIPTMTCRVRVVI